MFWGLTMEPQKRYTQTVADTFHISQAAIDIHSLKGEGDPTQVVLEFENNSFLLATLAKNAKVYQVPLDLNFQKGDHIAFRTVGPGIVHLTGYIILDDDDDLAARLMGEQDEDTDEELMEEISQAESSMSDESMQMPGKRKKLKAAQAIKSKKLKQESSDEDNEDEEDELSFGDSTLAELEAAEDSDEDDDWGDEEEDDEGDEEESDEDDDEEEEEEEQQKPPLNGSATSGKKDAIKTPKSEKKAQANTSKVDKTPKSQKKTPKPEGKTPKQDGKTPKQEGKTPKQEGKTPKQVNGQSPQKTVLEGGIVSEELKAGEGAVAKTGKMVTVYYAGRLKSNNKQFDASTGGPGFKFRMGRGEVIRGWDIGVQGMRVGGKRRLTIPAAAAYGAKGAPPTIPPHATLVFDVELRNVS